MIDEHLLRFNKKQKYLLFDTETCNLNLVWEKNLPWEYAWELCTIERVLERKEYLVNWELVGKKLEVGHEAAMMTGFYSKAPRIPVIGAHPKDLLEEFETYLYDPEIIPIAHNLFGFDAYIHAIHRKALGRKPDYSYLKRAIDTNLIAKGKKMNAQIPKNRDELMSYQYKVYNHVAKIKSGIKALCGDYDIDYDITKAHDAGYDVGLLRQILFRLLQEVEL